MAQYEEITIDQGADATIELYLLNKDGTEKNVTDHTVSGKLKKTYNTKDSDSIPFNTSIVDGANGIISFGLTNTETDALKAGRYVYDIEISYDSDGNTIVERILEGIITVTPSVTR